MLTKLRAAVETTIEKRHAAGAACFARPLLDDLDRFLAAMTNPLGGQAALQPDPTLPCRVDPRSRRTIAGLRDRTLKPFGKRNPTLRDGLQNPVVMGRAESGGDVPKYSLPISKPLNLPAFRQTNS
jgi:hypothetical protein